MRLPLELMYQVFNILEEEEGHKSLKQCALAYSQFSSHCQSLLFAKIALTFDLKEILPRRLRILLENNPKLGTYVRSLYTLWDEDGARSPSIPVILALCTRVNEFILHSKMYGVSWRAMFQGMNRTAVESIIHSPFLERLSIIGFKGIPLSTTGSPCGGFFTSLKLDLLHEGAVHPSDAGADIPPTPLENRSRRTPTFLRTLDVYPASLLSQLVEAMRDDDKPIFDFSQLSSLTVIEVSPRPYAPYINRLLRYGAPLECLKLTYSGAFLFISRLLLF